MDRAAWIAVLLVVTSCVDGGPGQTSAASTGTDDEGTRLTVTSDEPAVECLEDGSGAGVTLGFTVVSTAAADAAVLTAIVDGGEEVAFGEIEAGSAGWTIDGRTKTAVGEATFTLADGDHTIVICATQDGAGGREPKRACSDAVTLTVECEADEVHCNQGVGNGSEGCDPGNSNHNQPSNDEGGGSPGDPGRGGR